MKRLNHLVLAVLASGALLCSGCSKAELSVQNNNITTSNNVEQSQTEQSLMPYEMNKPWSIAYTRAVIKDYKGKKEQLDLIRKKAENGDLNAKYAYSWALRELRYVSSESEEWQLGWKLVYELAEQGLPLAAFEGGGLAKEWENLSNEERYKKSERYYRIVLKTPELVSRDVYGAFANHLFQDLESESGEWNEHEDSLLKSPVLNNPERIKEAVFYLKKSSEMGYKLSQPYLAEAYYHGIALPKDLNEAYAWSKYSVFHYYEIFGQGDDGLERCKRYVAEIPKMQGFNKDKAEARYKYLMDSVPKYDFGKNLPLPPPSPVSSIDDSLTTPPPPTAKVDAPCPKTGFWTCPALGETATLFLRKGDPMPGRSYTLEGYKIEDLVWHWVREA